MKKNILIISYGYPPLNDAGAQRPYALAKYLDKEKFNVTVITCENPVSVLGLNKNFDPSLGNVNLIKIKSRVGGSVNGFKAQNSPKRTFKNQIKKMFFNLGQQLIFPDKGMFWYPNVISYLKKNNDLIINTDVVFSTSPGVTNHRIANFIKTKKPDIQWISDFRDFYCIEHWEHKTGLKSKLHKKIEAKIIKEATTITFVTQTMQKAYQKFYPMHQNKMHCVFNGFDINEFPQSNKLISPSKKMTFFYAGSFYAGIRSPKPLLQLLDMAFDRELLTKEQVQIKIAGSIDDESKLSLKSFNSYICIDFLGNVPRNEVLNFMSQATFLWLIVGNIKSHYQTIPIKFFEYVAAKRPIINFAPREAEVSQIIKNHQMGCNIDTLEFSIEESYPIFVELVVNYKKGQYDLELVNDLNSFTWQKQMKKIYDLIEKE